MKQIARIPYIMINYVSAIWGVTLRWLRIKRDESIIPIGHYCYTPDYAKNAMKTLSEEGVYYIKTCKYYKPLGKYLTACTFCGFITEDPVFADQCKSCGKNYGIEDYD
jgi:hypothetical protein